MLLTVYLLSIGLHVFEGCTLANTKNTVKITAHTGGSVLLPCSCTDLQTKSETFSWTKLNTTAKHTWDEIPGKSGQYRKRVQLVNDSSPGNLSLLISHLTEEDEGLYNCDAGNAPYVVVKLTVKAAPTTGSSAGSNAEHSPATTVENISPTLLPPTIPSMHFFIIIPVLLLLLGLAGIICWKHRGQRQGQLESEEQSRPKRVEEAKDQVMYSTVVHSSTTSTPAVISTEEKTEYASITVN